MSAATPSLDMVARRVSAPVSQMCSRASVLRNGGSFCFCSEVEQYSLAAGAEETPLLKIEHKARLHSVIRDLESYD